MKAVKINTLPKLSKEDCKIFSQLLADVFVIDADDAFDSAGLRDIICQVMEERKLNPDEYLISKVLQLHDMIEQRIGCILFGKVSSGKTTLWKTLHSALSKKGVDITVEVINPKSMSREDLLGSLDRDTREWNDGVLISAARNAAKSENEYWVVCDGDLDPEWVESLNSVLGRSGIASVMSQSLFSMLVAYLQLT